LAPPGPRQSPVNTDLLELNLEINDINSATALAGALEVNTALRKLKLATNFIDSAGAAKLAAALRVNTALTDLDLTNNNVGSAGAAALAEALEINTALATIHLAGNSIDHTGSARLAAALRVNSSLTGLHLWHNEFDAAGAEHIVAAIDANPYALVRLTAAQRWAFLQGHVRRPGQQRSPVAKLPLDMIRRILTRYRVAQGTREWDGKALTMCREQT
jgi:hypothetical protein